MRWAEVAPRAWRLGEIVDVTLQADETWLRAALDALLENAVQYTDDYARIELSARGEGTSSSSRVADEGLGHRRRVARRASSSGSRAPTPPARAGRAAPASGSRSSRRSPAPTAARARPERRRRGLGVRAAASRCEHASHADRESPPGPERPGGPGAPGGICLNRRVTALYRKYRPQTFEEVVGQEAVVRTLTNAIEQGKVRQAYLFAGPARHRQDVAGADPREGGQLRARPDARRPTTPATRASRSRTAPRST